MDDGGRIAVLPGIAMPSTQKTWVLNQKREAGTKATLPVVE